MTADLCPVWVSRRWWPWPKRYECKGMIWGRPDHPDPERRTDYPRDVLLLILADDRKVFIHTAGRVITFGRRAFEWAVERMRQETGLNIPARGAT